MMQRSSNSGPVNSGGCSAHRWPFGGGFGKHPRRSSHQNGSLSATRSSSYWSRHHVSICSCGLPMYV